MQTINFLITDTHTLALQPFVPLRVQGNVKDNVFRNIHSLVLMIFSETALNERMTFNLTGPPTVEYVQSWNLHFSELGVSSLQNSIIL